MEKENVSHMNTFNRHFLIGFFLKFVNLPLIILIDKYEYAILLKHSIHETTKLIYELITIKYTTIHVIKSCMTIAIKTKTLIHLLIMIWVFLVDLGAFNVYFKSSLQDLKTRKAIN